MKKKVEFHGKAEHSHACFNTVTQKPGFWDSELGRQKRKELMCGGFSGFKGRKDKNARGGSSGFRGWKYKNSRGGFSGFKGEKSKNPRGGFSGFSWQKDKNSRGGFSVFKAQKEMANELKGKGGFPAKTEPHGSAARWGYWSVVTG